MLIKQTTAFKIIHFNFFMFVYVDVTFCFKYSASDK